jgi:hypothetical protein
MFLCLAILILRFLIVSVIASFSRPLPSFCAGHQSINLLLICLHALSPIFPFHDSQAHPLADASLALQFVALTSSLLFHS